MGLRQGDLKDLVYHIFEIDSYASKMGDDKNIVTLSFTVNDKAPADDLVKFLEGGYSFILDSDVTAGEQRDGKLSNIDDFKFRYYKGFKSIECTIENLDKEVPLDPNNYGLTVSEGNLNNYKNFFSNSYVDEIVMEDNVLTIKKSYVDDLKFNVVDFGDTFTTVKRINESMDVMSSYPEILFLTKCLGDYNICKYGDKFAFENSESTLVLERIL